MRAAADGDAGRPERGGPGVDPTDGAEAGPKAFPWDTVLHVGLHLLRLSPKDFWALTPLEFFIMAGGARGRSEGIGRDTLEGLMRAFPDG